MIILYWVTFYWRKCITEVRDEIFAISTCNTISTYDNLRGGGFLRGFLMATRKRPRWEGQDGTWRRTSRSRRRG